MLETESIQRTVGDAEGVSASSKREGAGAMIRSINQAWIEGRVDGIAPYVHPDMTMVFPGFAGRAEGREALIAGFRDFCENATVHEFREHDHDIDVAGDTAVVSFRYEMVYERSGGRYRATGRDLWVLQLVAGEWRAVWRTMLDVDETDA